MATRTADAALRNEIAVHAGARARMRRWLRRYLPAEVAGTSAALVAAAVAARGGIESAVVAAAWAEAFAFYLFVTARELRRGGGVRRSPRHVAEAVREVVTEFGAAEAVDTLFARPLLMYAFVATLGSVLAGVVVGKLAADVVFYALAIPAYELREWRRR